MLSTLDRHRQDAFAANDVTQLSDVYADGELLSQDQAALRTLVPPGCELIGLRTTYQQVRPTSVTAARAVLRTRAALAPARLECPRQPARMTPAHKPVGMIVVLDQTDGRVLIGGIQLGT